MNKPSTRQSTTMKRNKNEMYPLVMSVGLLEYYNDDNDDEEHNYNQHQHHNKQVTKYMENHICGVGCRCGYDAIFHDT
jgi:hypothetical protein